MPTANRALDNDKEMGQLALFEYLSHLLPMQSVTPKDDGCQQYIAYLLSSLGFQAEVFEINGVSNLIAKKGVGETRIAFAGHTDVVPTGEIAAWTHNPFSMTIKSGTVFGRGVADMKGGIAAMMSAIASVNDIINYDDYTFYFLITSDEEGEAEFGTKEIVNKLKEMDELPDLCIVGEPSATKTTGDTIKIGRRGAVSCEISIEGKSGHVAYPQYAKNAAHIASKAAFLLSELKWDAGSADFPGTTLQITSVDTGEWTDNIIPGQSKVSFNIRFSHMHSIASVKDKIQNYLLDVIDAELSFNWGRFCEPYFTNADTDDTHQLIRVAEQSIYAITGRFPKLSSSGGTSDGRFIASSKCQVIELGVPNYSIHQVNERVEVTDLIKLEKIYKQLIINLMS